MRRRSLALLLVASLGLPATSYAGSVFTPPAPVGTDDVLCIVQNLGKRDAPVLANVRSSTGIVIESQESVVPAGSSLLVAGSGSDGGGTFKYCEFQGLSHNVRGFMNVTGGSGSVMIPASK
jgi:hypothetical protein